MTTTIRGNNVNLTPQLEDFVHNKVEKLYRYLPNIRELHVDLSEQHSKRGPDVVTAQITVRHERGAILRTEEKQDKIDNGTVKSALQKAVDKMYRRIQRFKDKPRSKRMRERYAATPEEVNLAEALPDELMGQEEIDLVQTSADTKADPMIIRRKTVHISEMNEDEAVEQMELLGHNFFIYYNPDTQSMNIVYRRTEGGYGVLEPLVEPNA
jgi:putative sigma-54 modulation protein